MSYGVKYRCQFRKRKEETACYFDICELDFSGDISYLQAADTPVIISHQGASTDILNPILGSTLKASFWAIGQAGLGRVYQEFIYATNRQYRIDYYEDSTLFWQGYLLPDNYQEQYIAPPYKITLIATDQLGDLKNFKYQRQEGNLITEVLHLINYDTHVVSGLRILSAITDGSDFCYFYSSTISKLKEGDVLIATINLNMISGTPPKVGIFNNDGSSVAWGSNYVDLVHGDNRVELTVTEDIDEAFFVFENNLNAASWSCGEVLVEYKDLIIDGWEKDSVIIARCLQQTGLEFEIRENINLSDLSQQYGRLTHIKSNQDVFIEENEGLEEPWDCYKVLSEMLKPYGARILQVEGHWMLLRIDNQRASYDVRRYDENGEYIADTSFNPITEFTASSVANVIRPINQSGILTSLPGWQYIVTKQIFGYKNLVRNGGFEDCNKAVKLRRWNRRTMDPRVVKFWEPMNDLTKYYVDARDEKNFTMVLWEPIGALYYVYGGSTNIDLFLNYTKTIEVDEQVQYLRIKFDSKVLANDAAFTAQILTGLRIWLEVDSGTNKALKVVTGTETFLQWRDDTADAVITSVPITENDVWKTYELVTNGPVPASGTLHIELHRHYVGVGTGTELYETHYDNIEIYTAKPGTELDVEEGLMETDIVPSEEINEIELNKNNNIVSEELNLYFGDGYGFSLTELDDLYLYKGAKKAVGALGDYLTNRWGNFGGDYASYKTLLGWLEEFLKLMRQTPSQIFRGSIIGECSFLSVYQDEANGDKKFFTNIVQSYNPRENIWQVEAIELKDAPVEVQVPSIQMELDVAEPDIYVEYLAPDVDLTGISTIENGLEYDRMNVSVNYTNSGGAGNATVYWEIYDSLDALVDSGDQVVSFGTSSGSRALTGINYPELGIGYYMKAKETDDVAWQTSNTFNVEAS